MNLARRSLHYWGTHKETKENQDKGIALVDPKNYNLHMFMDLDVDGERIKNEDLPKRLRDHAWFAG